MGSPQHLDRRVSDSAETQRLALHRTRNIIRRACGQGIAGGPGLEQPQCFQNTRRLDLHRALEAIDLASPPVFHRADVKPADPDQYVDGAHMILGGKCRLRSPDNTIGKWSSAFPAHRSMNPPGPGSPPLNRLYGTFNAVQTLAIHPGEILREEFLVPRRLTPYAVAVALHVPRTRIERIAREEKPVTADTALRLGKFFKTGAAFWMNIQARFDLETAEDVLAPEIKKIASYEAV